jgi:hypothetical protein
VDEHAPPDEHPKSLWGRLQAAIRMHLNVQTVMTWCRDGKLEAYKIGGNKTNGRGGKWLIPVEAVDAHFKGRHLIHGDKRGPAK